MGRLEKADSAKLKEVLIERFFSYVAIPSQSQFGAGQVPSSPGQWDMAKFLQKELEALGLVDLHLSEYCCLTGKLPGNTSKDLPPVGFCAHLDTVDVNLNPEIHPRIVKYEGGDICLNEKDGIFLREKEHPEIKKYIGQEIIVSDGHSVLGADDKAALTSIVTAFEYLKDNPQVEHGDLYVAFVPDEEIGLVGAKHLDYAKFPVKFAYTLDCCELGEVVYQTFNAGMGTVHIKGVSAHPMSAKGVLINPTLIAVDFANLFNRLETPENTDGTDGYIWVQAINSNQSTATVSLNIRDHHKDRYEAKKVYIREAVAFMQKRHPMATISLTLEDTYGNIKDAITDDNRYCVDYIFEAMKRLGIEAKDIAMRGGTDGSYISTQGIPTPNFFTGAHNFHSNCEFLPVDSFEKSCRMVLTLLELMGEKA